MPDPYNFHDKESKASIFKPLLAESLDSVFSELRLLPQYSSSRISFFLRHQRASAFFISLEFENGGSKTMTMHKAIIHKVILLSILRNALSRSSHSQHKGQAAGEGYHRSQCRAAEGLNPPHRTFQQRLTSSARASSTS